MPTSKQTAELTSQAKADFLWSLPVADIRPSPFQPRHHFDPARLQQLADDIRTNGLIQPIVCRPVNDHFQLIAGERRWRAVQLNARTHIDARLVQVDDRQARLMCYAENLNREDLTAIEEAESIMHWLDACMLEHPDYATFGSTPIVRVAKLLSKLNSDYNHNTDHFVHRFMHNVEAAFAQLPKKLDWRSYYVNDLPLVTKLSEEVKRIAIEEKLSKAQAKAMQELHDKAPEQFKEVARTGKVAVTNPNTQQTERVPVQEASAREMQRLLAPTTARIPTMDVPPPAPCFPTGKYAVVYADPPWAYDNSGFDQSAASHYDTMATAEICALPVPNICTTDTVLFLWATSPLLPDALEVLGAWGFDYKASIVWDKEKAPGIGWFVRTQHELLLIATRDGNRHPNHKPESVLRVTSTTHSSKPEEAYELIERMYPGPYVELFGRKRRGDWEVWGNEVT